MTRPDMIGRAGAAAVLLAVAALVLTGCGGVKLSAQDRDVRSTKVVSLRHDCASATCDGSRQGAKFAITLPDKSKWNGTLLIWSHGYRNAAPIPANPLDPGQGTEPVDTSASAGPADAVTQKLAAQGYALAGSAFKTEGWDVTDAVAADEDLYSYFSTMFGKPKRVYIWGASLGGLITETLAEKHHDWVSGVAPVCGVLGGTNLNLDLALDVAYAVKTLMYPDLKLTGFASADEAVTQWSAAAQAIVARVKDGGTEGIAELLTVAALAGAPSKTKTFDGHDLVSTGQAYVEAVITALGYATWGRYDLEQRVGGTPSTNQGTDYSARISQSAQAQINAIAPGKLAGILARLQAGARVQADSAARAKADQLGNPAGAIAAPTITMHTVDDPLVIVQNEGVFAARVAAHKQGGDLVQLYTAPPGTYTTAPYGAGHCNFTADEMVGVITMLNNWVQKGVYPGPGAVQSVLNVSPDDSQSGKNTPQKQADGSASTGYLSAFTPGPWPASVGR